MIINPIEPVKHIFEEPTYVVGVEPFPTRVYIARVLGCV